jgi:hypothetical protein
LLTCVCLRYSSSALSVRVSHGAITTIVLRLRVDVHAEDDLKVELADE